FYPSIDSRPEVTKTIQRKPLVSNMSTSKTRTPEIPMTQSWGRKTEATRLNTLGSLSIIVSAPILLVLNDNAVSHFDGSLKLAIQDLSRDLFQNGLFHNLKFALHLPSWTATLVYTLWVLFQAALYILLPGNIGYGQPTPAGNILPYKTNGILVYLVTQITFLCLYIGAGLDSLAFIADNRHDLASAASAYGLLISIICQVKAHFLPSPQGEPKFSGNFIHDFFVGIELNPRIGELFDLKFFHIGRLGMLAWPLTNLSFIALQYKTLGYLTNSILITNFLQFLLIIDQSFNEDWYIRTMDIAHDHFGFNFAWGSSVFLPALYSIQIQYLARHPITLSTTNALIILALGLIGFTIFRGTNHQKDIVRRTNGKCNIFGKPARYLRCKYMTTDGKQRESLLVYSGWWGLARHANYLGELILTFAMCAPCGFNHILPWTYSFFIVGILFHRMLRVDANCARKYGENWDRYCDLVKWRVIPGVW
ncbi:hypothetical protein HYFRA_00002030, partial [Hymenoscyphus fraxineus]